MEPMFLLCDGRYGCDCKQKKYAYDRRHGTRKRYSMGCRCRSCTKANTLYMEEYRRKKVVKAYSINKFK